jgi:hypothetical protein
VYVNILKHNFEFEIKKLVCQMLRGYERFRITSGPNPWKYGPISVMRFFSSFQNLHSGEYFWRTDVAIVLLYKNLFQKMTSKLLGMYQRLN